MATFTRNAGQHVLETNNLDRVDEDFASSIDYDDVVEAPMAAWLAQKENSEQKDTEEFTLFTGELIPRTFTITVTITTTDAAAIITVSSTNAVVAKTLLHVPIGDGDAPGELLRVTAVTTRLNVTRLTTSQQIPDNATAVIVGNLDFENSTAGPVATDMEPASVTQYMSILKRRVDITKTERRSKVRGAANRLQEKLDRAKMDFLLDWEHSAWFSRGVKDATNRLRLSIGIFTQIANDSDAVQTDAANAALSMAHIGDTIAQAARWAKTKRWSVFHGQQGMAGLWELATSDLLQRVEDTSWGAKATMVNAPGGFTLEMIYARAFDIIGAPYADMLIGLDINAVKNVHLEGGRPKLERDVHTDKSGETESHQYRAQCGVAIAWPKRHFVIRDVGNF